MPHYASIDESFIVNQLTIRGFDDELRDKIESLAQEHGISLNKAALLLIRQGAGADDGAAPSRAIGDRLDEFIGSWTLDEEADFLASIEAMEQTDAELWQ